MWEKEGWMLHLSVCCLLELPRDLLQSICLSLVLRAATSRLFRSLLHKLQQQIIECVLKLAPHPQAVKHSTRWHLMSLKASIALHPGRGILMSRVPVLRCS